MLGHDAEDLERLGLAGVAHGVAVAHGAVVGLAGLGVLALAVVIDDEGAEVGDMANATAAIAVADAVGADLDAAAAALSEFKGARRRFTHVADIDGITVVDDYGHHPTEVAATLGAASELGFDRIVCVFQPHRYSRTQSLAADFGRAFDAADVLRVMDVFSAGEQPIPGVSGKTVVNSVREHDASKDVEYVPNRHELVDALVELVRPGDLLITQGAGDVTTIGPAFVEAMRARDAKRA